VISAKVVHSCRVEWVIKIFDPYKVSKPDEIFPVLRKGSAFY